jgi:hypothetical protein
MKKGMLVGAAIRALHRRVVPVVVRRRVDAFLIVRYVSMLSAHAPRTSLHAFMHRIIRAGDDDDGYRVSHSLSRTAGRTGDPSSPLSLRG